MSYQRVFINTNSVEQMTEVSQSDEAAEPEGSSVPTRRKDLKLSERETNQLRATGGLVCMKYVNM